MTLRQAVYLTAAQNFAREVRLLSRPPGDSRRAGTDRGRCRRTLSAGAAAALGALDHLDLADWRAEQRALGDAEEEAVVHHARDSPGAPVQLVRIRSAGIVQSRM